MKESLRIRMEKLLLMIVNRMNMLEESIDQYKISGDYESAMKCDIKMKTFKLIEEEIRKELLI